MLEFSVITPKDIPALRQICEKWGYGTCDYTLCGMFLWKEYYSYTKCIRNNTVFVKGMDPEGNVFFLLPVGEMEIGESIYLIEEYCAEKGVEPRFLFVPEAGVEFFKDKKAKEVEDWSDYIYDRTVFQELKGRELHKKKNRINKFRANNPNWRYERMNNENAVKAREFFLKKFDTDGSDKMLLAEKRIILQVFEDFSKFGLRGGLLFCDDRCIGFTMGDVLGDTLFVHFEKAEKDVDGSYEMLANCFVSDMPAEITRINREEDMGNQGIRRAKKAYAPIELRKKYDIIAKK